jgi:hypothetical protein
VTTSWLVTGSGHFNLDPNVDAYPFGLLIAYIIIGKVPDAWDMALIGPQRQQELRRLLDPHLPTDQDPLQPSHPLRKLKGDARDLVWQCCASGSERRTVSWLLENHKYFTNRQTAAPSHEDPYGLEGLNWLASVQHLKAGAAGGLLGMQQQ